MPEPMRDIIHVLLCAIFLSFMVLSSITAYLRHRIDNTLGTEIYIDEFQSCTHIILGGVAALCGTIDLLTLTMTNNVLHPTTYLIEILLALVFATISYRFWIPALREMAHVLDALAHQKTP